MSMQNQSDHKRILLFDVMDTIVTDPFFTLVPGFFGCDLKTLYSLQSPTAWVDFEKGLIDEETYQKTAFRDGRSYDHQALKKLCNESYAFIEGMQALLQRLKDKNIPMYALSNYPAWFEMIEARLQLSRFLQWDFVSCKTGFRKPDAQSYLGPAKQLGVEPSQCIFIDDRLHNCEGSAAVGMPSIHFKSAAQLEKSLTQKGIL